MKKSFLNLSKFFLLIYIPIFLSGCMTQIGYIKDHPDPSESTNYGKVKEWAFDVSDGYSSRGTMNRYSLYWGSALVAGGTGALGGLAATGYTGHANIIIPLSAAFLGTMFGYYQNEQQAQLYFAASDCIKSVISKSEKRYALKNTADETPLKSLITNEEKLQCSLDDKIDSENKKIEQIHTGSSLVNQPDAIIAITNKIEELNKAIKIEKHLKNESIARFNNLNILIKSSKDNSYESNCLTNDVNSIMRRVQIHLAKLDPKNVSKDLQNIKLSSNLNNSPSVTDPNELIQD
ncbi:hypothetical protein [Methylomonas sp. TEB]|uniref:hypothetical protein n=1 Tax=Methylomonas sp. TEB TaxID=3398229 RepID=UPI0039F60D0E